MLDPHDPAAKALFKETLREAIDEWMDKQFAKFGRWSLYGIVVFLFGVVTYLYLNMHGFKP